MSEDDIPQGPVVVLGRANDYLDVQRTPAEVVKHLARHDELPGYDFYDALGRPLRLDFVVAGPPVEAEVRQRVEEAYAVARREAEASRFQESERLHLPPLDPPNEENFSDFVQSLGRRYAVGTRDYGGSRLHNFWHRIRGISTSQRH